MTHLPKPQHSLQSIRIRGPEPDGVVVCVEPWSECFDLGPQATIDVVFCGPNSGILECLPDRHGLVLYGWVGSDFIALQNSRVAGRQPTVEEIVRQELEISRDKIEMTATPLRVDDIAQAQVFFDQDPEVNQTSQNNACDGAAILILSLAECFVTSEASQRLIWEIARRLVRTRGLFLLDLERERQSDLRNLGQFGIADLIFENSISAIPSLPSGGEWPEIGSSAKPRGTGSESAATRR